MTSPRIVPHHAEARLQMDSWPRWPMERPPAVAGPRAREGTPRVRGTRGDRGSGGAPAPRPDRHATGWRRFAASVAIALALGGCATTQELMPTPALYTGADARIPFPRTSVHAPRPTLDLLFITDRAPAPSGSRVPYTAARSRSMAFGSSTVEFGDGIDWDALVSESVAPRRAGVLHVKLGSTRELGRFPAIPYELDVGPGGAHRAPQVVQAFERTKRDLQEEIGKRVAAAPRKEVVLFVHGFRTSFEDAALTMGQLCHFLGREFVCAIFSWPAGARGGLLLGYDADRESAEYAVEDLVKALRMIGATPGVQQVHLVAHSRGSDTVASAVSALGAEAYMRRSSPDREFRLGNIVLVAPDLDGDVAVSKIFKVFSDPDLPFGDRPDANALIPPAPGLRLTLYASPDAKAIATAGWLFGSIARLGRLDATMFTGDQIDAIGSLRAIDIIEVRGTTDLFGHSYLTSNPRVSADIIALLRYGLRPNDPGRPLERIAGSFWRLTRR